jgi:two-component system, NtrC family, nitrogen regulation sensor histidine kinase NtrY
MILKHYLIRVIILVILIALAGLLMVWSFTRDSLVMARFTFIMIWLLLIAWLIYYVTKTNRTLKVFMESLRYLDAVRTQKGKGRLFEELDRLYNEVIGIIHKVEVEKEMDRQYFKSIIDHTGTGILSFDDTGNIQTINAACKKLLGIRSLDNIRSLSAIASQLPEILTEMKPGNQKLLRITVNNEIVGLWLKMTEIRVRNKRIRLAAVQNIQHELEEEELDAWQKLIRVLTHEIMNSVTPVNSLTHTMIRMFEHQGKPKSICDLDDATLKNALEGLHSIEKRSHGLIGFVQSYRSLTRIRKPVFNRLDIGDLLMRLASLVKHELQSRRIRLVINMERDNLQLNADEKLVEQVLINLVNNAVYALRNTDDPTIQIAARTDQDGFLLEVMDNGEGIPSEIVSSIFIPFYTTREEGSGIGLSLSRQIMRVHGGSISVRSKPGETTFLLRFPVG